MKQLITIEIEEKEGKYYNYELLIMIALAERRNTLMTTFTKETEEQHRKIAIKYEELLEAVAKAKVKRYK